MKKSIVFVTCITILMVFLFGSNTVYAANIDENENTHERIEELYAERARLSVNLQANKSRINEIDKLVAELGVTPATEEDLAKIYSNNKSRVAILGECYGTDVTQERYVTNLYGKMMELQIIRVVPDANNGVNGELYHSAITDAKVISAEKAVSNIIFKCVVPTGLGFVPVIGDSLNIIITGAQLLSQINAEFNCTVMKTSVYYEYTAASSETWIYVKPAGVADSYQKLCYNGNEIIYEGRYICKGIAENGNSSPFSRYEKVIGGAVKSPNYSNCKEVAKKNFFYYTNYNTTFNPDEHVHQIDIIMNDTTYNIFFYKVGFPMSIN